VGIRSAYPVKAARRQRGKAAACEQELLGERLFAPNLRGRHQAVLAAGDDGGRDRQDPE
jgi:hypothetical protein